MGLRWVKRVLACLRLGLGLNLGFLGGRCLDLEDEYVGVFIGLEDEVLEV